MKRVIGNEAKTALHVMWKFNPYKPRAQEKFRECLDLIYTMKPPAQWNKKEKYWTVVPSLENVAKLKKHGFHFPDGFFDINEPWVDIKLPDRITKDLFPYQIEGIQFLVYRKGRGLIADEMGTGKTVTSCRFVRATRGYTLMVVPSTTKPQWVREFIEWTGRSADLLFGQTSSKLPPGNYVINWEILTYWKETLKKLPFTNFIADECQMMSNPQAKRTKAAKSLAKKIPHFLPMSGTPITRRPAQFFTVLNLLDSDLFPSLYKFHMRYCDPKHDGFGMKYDGSSNEEELHSLLKPLMIRRMKKDVKKDLPKVTRTVVPLYLNGKIKDYFNRENNFFNYNKDECTAFERENAFKSLKYELWALKEKAVLDWIDDFVNDGGAPLIIGCWHTIVIDSICKRFNCPCISGSVTGNKREKVIQDFKDKKIDILPIQMGAGGVGLDGLQTVCCNMATVEFAHTPTVHDQFEARLDRVGQTLPISCYYLVGENTMEEDLMIVLDQIRQVLAAVVDGKRMGTVPNMLTGLLELAKNRKRKEGKSLGN